MLVGSEATWATFFFWGGGDSDSTNSISTTPFVFYYIDTAVYLYTACNTFTLIDPVHMYSSFPQKGGIEENIDLGWNLLQSFFTG